MIGLRHANNSALYMAFFSEIRRAFLKCLKDSRCGSLSLQQSRTMTRELRPPKRPLCLDAQATTPMDPRVLDAMLPYMNCYHGNPHSRTHFYGWEAEAGVEKARKVSIPLVESKLKEKQLFERSSRIILSTYMYASVFVKLVFPLLVTRNVSEGPNDCHTSI